MRVLVFLLALVPVVVVFALLYYYTTSRKPAGVKSPHGDAPISRPAFGGRSTQEPSKW